MDQLSPLSGLLDFLWPPRCASCGSGAPRAPLCGACHRALGSSTGELPEKIDVCVTAVPYSGHALRWLQAFKYPARGLAGLDPTPIAVVCQLIRDAAMRAPGPDPHLVIPVPLHRRRLRTRGFNPATTLAREVVRARGGTLATHALTRTRDTPSQTGLGRSARRRNVAGAFHCGRLEGDVVWLIDDVVTTGATLAECARRLRHNGAKRVLAICVAQTPRDFSRPRVTQTWIWISEVLNQR